MTSAALRILLVDDHTLVRHGLRRTLETTPGFEVVGEAGSAAVAVEEAVRLRPDIVDGQLYLSPRLSDSLGDGRATELSKRERGVLALIGKGLSNRQIAANLSLSANTIESHRRRIIEKLDLHTTAEQVRYALRHRIAE